jgi:hypothetical protein
MAEPALQKHTDMETTQNSPTKPGACKPFGASNVRRVFSVNVPESSLANFMDEMSARHPRGVSGYVRDLVEADMKRRRKDEAIAAYAVEKLSSEERRAIAASIFDQQGKSVILGKHMIRVPNTHYQERHQK